MSSTALTPADVPALSIQAETASSNITPLIRVCVKQTFLDTMTEHVIAQLNTKDRKLGVHGKGVEGFFIAEDKISAFKPYLRNSIATMLMCNGVGVQGFSARDIDLCDTALQLREALGEAYTLEPWGRVVRAAEAQIERIVLRDLNAAKVLPGPIDIGMYRN